MQTRYSNRNKNLLAGLCLVLLFQIPQISNADTTLITSGTLPAANNLDITNIPTSYQQLLLTVKGASSNTATRALRIQGSTDNGSTFLTTGYTCDNRSDDRGLIDFLDMGGTMAAADTATTTLLFSFYAGGNPTSNWLYNISTATDVKNFGACVYYGGSGAGVTINALRITWNSTGNFDAGSYSLWGISGTTTSSGGNTSTSTTSTVDTAELQMWYAYWTFFATMVFVIWLLRRRK